MRLALSMVLWIGVGCSLSDLDRFHAPSDGGGGSGGDGGGNPDFSISASSPFLMVRQGGSESAAINLTRTGGFNQPVAIGINGLPAGVTADPLTIPADVSTGSLTLHAAASAAQGGPVNLTLMVPAARSPGSPHSAW